MKKYLLLYSRGRFVRINDSIFFYNNDGKYIDEISDLFDVIYLIAPLITTKDNQYNDASKYTYQIKSPKVECVFLPATKHLSNILIIIAKLFKVLIKTNYILSMGPTYLSNLLLILTFNHKKILYNGIDWTEKKSYIKQSIEKRSITKANFVLCTGEHLLKKYKNYGQNNVATTIPFLNIPLIKRNSLVKTKNTEEKKNFTIINVGHLLDRKSQITLLKAALIISKKGYTNISIEFVGKSNNNEFEKKHRYIIKLLKNIIHFHGHISNASKLSEIYKKADVMCITSLSEGFPRVAYEAMAYNIPIISTPLPGFKEIFMNYKDILYYDFKNYNELSDKIIEMYKDRELRMTIINNNNIFINNIFKKTPKKQMQEILNLL